MPPKVKVTKEAIIHAAVELVRASGSDAINARTLAAALNCSTQPIFSNFPTMDALRHAVLLQADALCREYREKEVTAGVFPAYKANGMAYIRFAKEEKELFKLLYMRNRGGEAVTVQVGIDDQMEIIVQNNTGLADMDAKLFHLEMWAVVHGIATMLATGFVDLDWELISKVLTDTYLGLRKQYGME